MHEKEFIVEEENLYMVDGFDGKKYIIKLETSGGIEVGIKDDTYETIRNSIDNKTSIIQALQSVKCIRNPEIVIKEIDKLIEKRVIKSEKESSFNTTSSFV